MSLQKQFLKSKKVYKVTFSLPIEAASAAKAVLLVGDFNNWDKNEGILMSPKKGAYSAAVELEPGKEYQFRYLVDGETWENDWEADKYITTPFGIDNSVVVVPPQEGA